MDEYGSPTYAPHLAGALARLIETEAYGVYHLAGRGGCSRYDLAAEIYQQFKINTPLRPITSAELALPAQRPKYAVLTTIQDPAILLPPWQEGVAEFVWKLLRAGG
jgi:dTDP-4-dehydrorhamnose reductase